VMMMMRSSALSSAVSRLFRASRSRRHGSLESAKPVATQALRPVLAFTEFVRQVGPTLKPPVANKMLFGDGFLKVMIVGGPNKRRDYHLQAGEEFFWQIKGDLTLDVVMEGQFKTITVPQGHCFLLPSRVPHSPKRPADSMGVVIERGHEHAPEEVDRLRWYVEEDEVVGAPAASDESKEPAATRGGTKTARVLYEEFFTCTDLGTQLGPVIKRFSAFQHEQCRQPAEDERPQEQCSANRASKELGPPPSPILSDPSTCGFGEPFPFDPCIDRCLGIGVEDSGRDKNVFEPTLPSGHHVLWQGREKTVSLLTGGDRQETEQKQEQQALSLDAFATERLTPKVGNASAAAVATEGLLWQVRGQATIRTGQREVVLETGDMLLVDPAEQPAMVEQHFTTGEAGDARWQSSNDRKGHGSATLVVQNLARIKK